MVLLILTLFEEKRHLISAQLNGKAVDIVLVLEFCYEEDPRFIPLMEVCMACTHERLRRSASQRSGTLSEASLHLHDRAWKLLTCAAASMHPHSPSGLQT